MTVTQFDSREKIAVQMEKVSNLCGDIDSIKTDVTTIKQTQNELNITLLSNQKIIMDDLKALRQKAR